MESSSSSTWFPDDLVRNADREDSSFGSQLLSLDSNAPAFLESSSSPHCQRFVICIIIIIRQIVKMHPSMHWAEPAVQVVPLFRAQCTRSIYLVKTFFSFFHQQQPLKSSSLQANFGNWKWQGRKGDITDLSLAEEIEEYALWVRYTIDLLGLYWFALWHKKLLAEMTDPQSKNTTF